MSAAPAHKIVDDASTAALRTLQQAHFKLLLSVKRLEAPLFRMRARREPLDQATAQLIEELDRSATAIADTITQVGNEV